MLTRPDRSPRRLPVADLPPCQECGACCVDLYGDGTVADLQPEDEQRLGPRRLQLYTVQSGGRWPDTPHHATSTRVDALGNTVCRALRGSVGRSCSCRIYEDRPTLCRSFERGSRACLSSRREVLGL